jgi:hypothetical protein
LAVGAQQIALVVTDYDAAQSVLSVTKARVHGLGSASRRSDS